MNGIETRFKPGDQRINRRGRPKAGHSIPDYISSKTRRGRDLMDFYWQIFRDEKEDKDLRMKAAEKLEYRLLGKPAQTIEGHIQQAGIVLHVNVNPLARPDE